MDGSNPSEALTSQVPEIEEIDFDRSSPMRSSEVLRREIQDESGQDYYVYLPAQGAADAPVLVVVHDLDRDARAQAEAFSAVCEQRGIVLLAPHFASDRYPNFQRLGRSRHAADDRKSANDALDLMLEELAALSGANVERFYIFGFGSGGRFAMRYAMLNPERVAGAVVVQPGAYTFPDDSRRFPRGIAPSRKRPDFQPDPNRFLRVAITLLECEGERVDGSPALLEDVDRESEEDAEANGRGWVDAMVEAALGRKIIPAVTFGELEGPVDSFDAFAAKTDLDTAVLDVLFSSEVASSSSDTGESDAKVTDPWLEAILYWRRVKPIAVPALIVLAIATVLMPILFWAQYRSTHVISRDAVLRGHIAEVGAQLNGVVKKIEVDSGDRVAAGQVVVRLEDRQFEAKRMQAASRLEKAIRELEVERLAIANERTQQESSLRGVSADRSAAQAELQVAASRAQEANRRLELQRSLAKEGLVSEERVRAAETELRTARALVDAARAGQSSAVAGEEFAKSVYDGFVVRDRRISVLESEISGLKAELALAEANLESTIIRAPSDGAVVRRIVEPGGSTVAGQPIISLWLGDDIWVEAWIDEAQFGEVAVGSLATVTFVSHPDREFSGVIESLAVATDIELPDSEVPQPRRDRMRDAPVVSARVKLDSHDEILIPGLSAVVAIRKQER